MTQAIILLFVIKVMMLKKVKLVRVINSRQSTMKTFSKKKTEIYGFENTPNYVISATEEPNSELLSDEKTSSNKDTIWT